MFSIVICSRRFLRSCSYLCSLPRTLCSGTFDAQGTHDGFGRVEDYLRESWKSLNFDRGLGENTPNSSDEFHYQQKFSPRRSLIDGVRDEARRILEILQQDGPGFDTKAALDDLNVRVSGLLVREVLLGIVKNINDINKHRSAKLGFKFFVWCGQCENYKHTPSAYHLIMRIFKEAEEFKAMWRLVDEMTEKGYPVTARTFNILICTCGEAGLAKKVVERFIKSKTFNYRPFRDSFNAILHSLLVVKQYRLIEWVHHKMLSDGHSPDVLTYNIIMCAKYRLGKVDEFHRVLDEMSRNGLSPDFHTYNLLLHMLGKGDKPLTALNLLNHMKDVGCDPTVAHLTTLMDGLSRAGNLEACKYFFDEMVKHGGMPDVVCYTVMITGYVVAGEIDKADEMFKEMIRNGQLPNVFTYNSMIRGLCIIGKFEEAFLMLQEMESRGCNPNFFVYTTLVGYLRNAGKLSQAHAVIRHMVEKGRYIHLLSKIKRYRRC